MTEQRNDYGYPLTITEWPEFLAVLASAHPGASLIGYRPRPMSKLERAQAIAAEVRARKFPPVRRLNPESE